MSPTRQKGALHIDPHDEGWRGGPLYNRSPDGVKSNPGESPRILLVADLDHVHAHVEPEQLTGQRQQAAPLTCAVSVVGRLMPAAVV